MSTLTLTVDAGRASRAAAMLVDLRVDIERDIEQLEGAAFTPEVVSTYLGGLAAQVDALANVLLFMLGDES